MAAADELERGSGRHRDVVAVILAVGIATALNGIIFAVCYDAIMSAGPGLSENATQIITGAFGGIIGILGTYIGLRTGDAAARRHGADVAEPPDGT